LAPMDRRQSRRIANLTEAQSRLHPDTVAGVDKGQRGDPDADTA
jgi:hypothetical protein